jgi:predicted component of type VI protein secretion system
LLEDKKTWQRLVTQGRKHIVRLHGREAVYKAFKEVLAAVMQNETSRNAVSQETDEAGEQVAMLST